MIPNKSNTTNGCDNTSSNCVVWQGPNLPCVDVCTGDTISDVIAKLCESIVGAVTAAPGVNIDTINQLCIETNQGRSNTIQELIQNIINEVCDHNSSAVDPCSCVIPLPKCLQYRNEQGNDVVSLPLYDGKTGESYAVYLANKICNNISSINGLQNDLNALDGRVTSLESSSVQGRYIAPKVVPNFVGRVGSPTSIERMLIQTEEAYGETRRALGTVQDLNKSIGYAANNLSALKMLNGSGTYSAQPGWITSPRNVAQSFQNLWLTTNDIRNAVENLNETVANPLCSSITNSVSGNIRRTSAGAFQVFELDFTESSIPSGYVSCNGKGTRVTITDASLNTLVKYIDIVGHYQNSDPYRITAEEFGNLDTGSNYSVKVEFCFENEDNQCADTQTINIENKTSCPTTSIGAVTGETIPFSITDIGLPKDQGYTLSVSLNTRGGSLIDSRSTSSFAGGFSGTFSGLTGSTQYSISTSISQSGSTSIQECPSQTVSTIAPVCTSVAILPSSTTWKLGSTTPIAGITFLQTGASIQLLGTRYNGSAKITWTAGYDATNQVIVEQHTYVDNTTAATIVPTGSNVDNNNAVTPIVCGGNTIPVTGAITQSSAEGSGWRYIGSLTSPVGNKHYVFAEVNIDTNTVTQVYFCCDCSQLSLTAPQRTYFARKDGGAITIPITAVGFIAGTTYTWTIATSPSNGTATMATSPSQTGSTATFTYVPDTTKKFTYDSFSVTLTNDCGTSSILTIPIVSTFSLPLTDTDITVMVDSASVSLSDALIIKSSFEDVKALMKSNNSNWIGTFNYVAINSSPARSSDYLKHIMGMVENIGTATALTDPALTLYTSGTWYTQFMGNGTTLPSYWSGATARYPSSIALISFVNTTNSTGTYGAATLGSAPTAWNTPAQPTTNGASGATKYQEDYDALVDITSGAAPTSAWGTEASGTKNTYWTAGSKPFTFSQIIVNKITGSANVSAAAALQMASALTGPTDLTNQEFAGMQVGGSIYPVDLSSYLKNGVSASANPYNTSLTTPAGNTLTGLQVNFDISANLYLENGVVWNTTLNSNMKNYMLGMVGQTLNSSLGTPSRDPALKIGGTTAVFGVGSTRTNACSAAASSSPAIWSANATVANTTPSNPFQGTVLSARAYTTQSAATNGQAAYELITGQYYAIYLASGTRYVALYNKTADSSGHFWTAIGTC
tara:strand:+ start:191 stop:3760 length:3570 start_codon:yes stop_codon:yes gene_type:complete